MFGHTLLPAFAFAAPLELPLLAATASSAWWMIGGAFALIACGLTYGYLYSQKKKATKPTAPAPQNRTPVRSPFDELVDAHKLDGSEVAFLRRAVQQLELEQPILLFVDPALLARLCEASPEAVALRQKLFGSPAGVEQSDSDSIDQSCSDLQAESPDASQAEADQSTSIDTVAADLLGDLPSADVTASTESPVSVAAEQPIGTVSAS